MYKWVIAVMAETVLRGSLATLAFYFDVMCYTKLLLNAYQIVAYHHHNNSVKNEQCRRIFNDKSHCYNDAFTDVLTMLLFAKTI